MTLPVPLSVRLGDTHITRAVSDVSWRKEAIGGLRSLSFSLNRDIANLDADLAPFTKVYVYDSRTAETLCEARLADSGRSAGTDGQAWEIVAFGPVQHASDDTRPLVYVDRDLGAWRFLLTSVGSGAEFGASTQPGVVSPTATVGLLASWADATPVNTNDTVAMRYGRLWEAGQKLGSLRYNWISGNVSSLAGWVHDVVFCTNGDWAAYDLSGDVAFSTAGGAETHNVGTDFTNGRNTVDIRTNWRGGASATTGDANWHLVAWPVVESLRLTSAGVEVTSGYTGSVKAGEVVADLLGRMLPDFDGANASVDLGTFVIEQLVYPDGVTAEQVLEDLMRLEPSYRWVAGPDTTGNGYSFRWEQWPTSVRYEITLDDGGSFPITGQSLYNVVGVRWQDLRGDVRTTTRTKACEALDAKGLTRRAHIDLSSDVGTQAQAEQAGDTFLEQHNVPTNSGSLSVSRPIRDVISGRMVQPWEIEPGELVRVRGVESYPDALNADSSDGRAVFRIHAVDYNSAENRASLSLDTDPTDVASSLAKLLKERRR